MRLSIQLITRGSHRNSYYFLDKVTVGMESPPNKNSIRNRTDAQPRFLLNIKYTFFLCSDIKQSSSIVSFLYKIPSFLVPSWGLFDNTDGPHRQPAYQTSTMIPLTCLLVGKSNESSIHLTWHTGVCSLWPMGSWERRKPHPSSASER